jgi:hypothetical protein
MGSPDYGAAQRRRAALGPQGFLAHLAAKEHAEVDEWQTEMQLKPMRVGGISLYTGGLSAEERSLTGVELVDSLEEAIHRSVEQSGDTRVAVIPEGPYVVPLYRPGA